MQSLTNGKRYYERSVPRVTYKMNTYLYLFYNSIVRQKSAYRELYGTNGSVPRGTLYQFMYLKSQNR